MPPLSPFSRTCLALVISQAVSVPAQAATILVNSALDDGDGDNCTLREAIVSINSETLQPGCTKNGDFNDTDTIDFSAPMTITLGGTDIDIDEDLIINGLGEGITTVSGNDASRIFHIDIASVTVSLNSLTVTGGSADSGGAILADTGTDLSLTNATVSGNSASFSGGGLYSNGGIITLTNTAVSGNGAGEYGGGLYSNGAITTLTNSTVSGNSAGKRGAGIYAWASSIGLTNSIVSGNSAGGQGGGLFNKDSTGTLTTSTVSGNSAKYGGGIYATNSSSLSLTNSTVSGNSANYGGGIHANSSSSVNLSNSTVSGNSASTGTGGGIEAQNSSSISLNNSTVSGNSARFIGGIYAYYSSISLSNSIVSGNMTASRAAEIYNYNSSIMTNNANLLGDDSHTSEEAFVNFTPGAGDINANKGEPDETPLSSILNPILDDNNGGPTATHLLVAGSPAINAADISVCPATDQRGEPRDSGFFVVIPAANGNIAVADLGEGQCDIGSVEFSSAD